MHKYPGKKWGGFALASALALAASPALAAPEVSLGGCTLDNHRFAMTVIPTTSSSADLKRYDLVKAYLGELQNTVRSAVEDSTSEEVVQRPFLARLANAVNDHSLKFNAANNSNLGVKATAIDVQPDPSCKSVVRLNPKP